MKRKILPLLCAAALAMSLLAGCGSNEATKDVVLSSITGAIQSTQKSQGSYTDHSISDLKTKYDIDSGDVKQFVAKENQESGVEIVMIEATSDDAANRIEEKFRNYRDLFSVSDLDSIVKHGNYVALFVGADHAKMAAAFDGFVVAE